MSHKELIEKLKAQMIKRISLRMENFEESYEVAKAKVAIESVAGSAVWAEVDKHFA